MSNRQLISYGTAKARVNQQVRYKSQRSGAHLPGSAAGLLGTDSGDREPDGIAPDPVNAACILQYMRNLGPHCHDEAYVRHYFIPLFHHSTRLTKTMSAMNIVIPIN
jgi:hypothetical protein